ncbi:hypothetical protein EX30DRAFT_19845 [Ascodesmis nigricans]|uniref:Uncharacterized protein n=1 Tax=Ascodesmis nigricans TaxID=341454 RepID=A0A4S2N7D9_9PEZI|nr:hypothetical protein EX30DRAFT_19845 [Ascodesmis nigricans]
MNWIPFSLALLILAHILPRGRIITIIFGTNCPRPSPMPPIPTPFFFIAFGRPLPELVSGVPRIGGDVGPGVSGIFRARGARAPAVAAVAGAFFAVACITLLRDGLVVLVDAGVDGALGVFRVGAHDGGLGLRLGLGS